MNLKVYKKLIFSLVTGTVLITSPKLGIVTFAQEIEIVEEKKEKIINNFIIIVDFIYFDGEIKGVKFDELKDSTKEEVYQTLSNLDEKIENKFPNYKDHLEEKYNKIKSIVTEKINVVNEKIESNETFSEIKNNTIEGLTEFKDITKVEYESAKSYVKK